MTEPDGYHPKETGSFWHRRRSGLRYLYSAAAIVGGVVFVFRFARALDGSSDATWGLVAGIALIVLGLLSIPVYSWMDKRRL